MKSKLFTRFVGTSNNDAIIGPNPYLPICISNNENGSLVDVWINIAANSNPSYTALFQIYLVGGTSYSYGNTIAGMELSIDNRSLLTAKTLGQYSQTRIEQIYVPAGMTLLTNVNIFSSGTSIIVTGAEL